MTMPLKENEFRAFVLPEDANVNVFVGDVAGGSRNNTNRDADEAREIRLPALCNESELFKMFRTLNQKQQEYFSHVMHNIKYKAHFLEYVGGGAGVGKSRLI